MIGPMGEIPATGRAIESPYTIWVDIEAGLARSMRVYMDGMAFAAQLGLLPGPQA